MWMRRLYYAVLMGSIKKATCGPSRTRGVINLLTSPLARSQISTAHHPPEICHAGRHLVPLDTPGTAISHRVDSRPGKYCKLGLTAESCFRI